MADPTNRCPDCDAPLATQEQLETHPEGCECAECESVCWRVWHLGCVRPHIDWRAEALALRERIPAIVEALDAEIANALSTNERLAGAPAGGPPFAPEYFDGLAKAIDIVKEAARG